MGKPGRVSGIYGIYCKGSGKWYVGASVDIYRRFKDHMRNCRRDAKRAKFLSEHGFGDWSFSYHGNMGRDYAKYRRKSFSLHHLEDIKDPRRFHDRENYWMSAKSSRSKGYNTQTAGNHRDW